MDKEGLTEMVTVFSFKSWDRKIGGWVVFPYKLPVEGVIAMCGMIVEGSGQDVLERDLNEYGKYLQPKQPTS